MNAQRILHTFTVLLFALAPVSNAESPTQAPFKLVESKTEATGLRNVMELYAFAGPFNAAELKKFCIDRKSKSTAKAFLYVVIFDEASNAKFPSTPFTAEYGTDDDLAKHIRAIYVYNKMNGFSELRYHDKNIWDNIPSREKL